jgi:type I restriction enzyme M protein
VLYRGGAEMKIRKYLIDNNYVDTVIQLPANLFFGVTIATCIIVLKKSKRENKTLFIDASNLFVHEGNKNKLSPQNIADIVEEYAQRNQVKHFSALVDNQAIAANGYNLSVSSYVEAEDTRPQTDIEELNRRIDKIVERECVLRKEIDEIIKELEG